jgi:hypothetical protein
MDNEINKKLDDFIENTKFNFENINLKIKEIEQEGALLKSQNENIEARLIWHIKRISDHKQDTLSYKISTFFAKMKQNRIRKKRRREQKKIENAQHRLYKLTGKDYGSGS